MLHTVTSHKAPGCSLEKELCHLTAPRALCLSGGCSNTGFLRAGFPSYHTMEAGIVWCHYIAVNNSANVCVCVGQSCWKRKCLLCGKFQVVNCFILFCAGMKHQHFQILGNLGQSVPVLTFLPVSPCSWWLAGQSCAVPGHPAPWPSPGRGRELPAGRAAQGVSRASLMKPAFSLMKLLTGKQQCVFKADRYCILFSYVFIWNFFLKQNEVKVSSLSIGDLINSTPQRPEKCTDWGAEGRWCTYAQKKWQYFLLFQDKTFFHSLVLSAARCVKKASSSSQDKSFKIEKEKSRSFNYEFILFYFFIFPAGA